MNDSIDTLLQRRWEQFAGEIRSLLQTPAITLGETRPPKEAGVYILFDEYTTIAYVGIAKDLYDRFCKHISGDESHAIQRALADRLPNRLERRKFIKEHVRAKWLVHSDATRLADLERLLIWLYQPPWNKR